MIRALDDPEIADLRAPLAGYARGRYGRFCERPSGAFANCSTVSAHFAGWMRARGYVVRLLRLFGPPGYREWWPEWERVPDLFISHQVAEVSGRIVDWTHRQFVPYSPYPLVADEVRDLGWWEAMVIWEGRGRPPTCQRVQYWNRESRAKVLSRIAAHPDNTP